MKRREIGKFQMIESVIYFFDKNKLLQEEIIRLKDAVSLLNLYGSRMKHLLPKIETKLGGITTDKAALRGKLITLMLKLSKLMEARGRDRKDRSLIKAVHCSLSDLRRPADKDFIKRCRQLIAAAEKQKRFLKAYGLKEEKLKEMRGLLVRFDELVPRHRNERSKKAAHHTELRRTIKKACYLLKHQIDPMMEVLSEKYTHECDIYKLMRRVICHGRKRKAYGGRFKDKATGKPLQDVQMTVVETAEKIVNEFASKVTVVIEKAGYKKIVLKDVDILQLHELAGELEPETEKLVLEDTFPCFE